MSLMIVALLLGAVTQPAPAQDDDKAEPPRTKLIAPGKPGLKPSSSGQAAARDDKQPKSAAPSRAQEPDAGDDDEEGRVPASSTIVVTARRLDSARTQVDAALGSTVYSLTNETIENRPGGETGSISDILAQAPGVTLSGKTLNVRGSPANQVRINNVIVPEAISDPADHLSSRLAQATRLVTGTLPAQFGFAPAGVISVTTKNGLYQHSGQAELFASSDGMVEPSVEWAGSAAATSLFASGSFEHDQTIVADADGNATHDRRDEIEGLGFADHVIDDDDRISMIIGGSRERHHFGATSIGAGSEESGDAYAVGTFQHSQNAFTVQASMFAGSASDKSRFSERTRDHRGTLGTQIDANLQLDPANTLRFGLLGNHSTVRELGLNDRVSASRTALATYVQDEWKITPAFTFNPGVRVEWLRGLQSAATVEPRASLVWQSEHGFTAHVGYARYASAPPIDEAASADLRDERDDYFDAGLQQRVGSLTLGLDAYSRSVRNYLAEHATIGSAVPTAFSFGSARIRGLELSATYSHGPLSAWANLAFAHARARTIIGGTALFSPEILAAASMHYVPLASERPATASGGMTWRLGKLSLSGDLLVSSGAVRTLQTSEPNESRHSAYGLLGLAGVYHVRIADRPADIRLDLTNLTNGRYVASDAANLEGGWTRRGRGRAVTIGFEQGF